jgi:aspartate-semialdehyde dehydrogenase
LDKIGVGILGATGAIGEVYRNLLDNHPYFSLKFLGSGSLRLEGSLSGLPLYGLEDKHRALELGVKILFSSLDTERAIKFEPVWAQDFLVISSSSAFRDEKRLIFPEINGRKIVGQTKGIFSKSNCTLHPIALPLKQLLPLKIRKVAVTTMQAISGAGRQGLSAMDIFDNVIPFIEGEENKIQEELNLILEQKIPLNITCCRVPVMDGHLVVLDIELEEVFDLEMVYSLLSLEPTIQLLEQNDRPQPRLDRDNGNGMNVSIGRLRKGEKNSLQCVALAHNRIRGAAGTGIKLAEMAYGFTQPR